MRNLKLEIEYDGSNYCGWQTQRKAPKQVKRKAKTIQETIEKTLRRILQEKIHLVASGRTDSGVHAIAQAANFKTGSDIALYKLQKALNALLPKDISIAKIEEKALSFHSRFSSRSKVYRYTILNRSYPSVFLRNRAYLYSYPLDIKLMQKESRVLLGRHNFKSFQAQDKIERPRVRTIKKIKVFQDSGLIHLDIEADGFLYNMVRNIVGTLIEIGRGKLAKGSLKKILRARNRKLAGPTSPACGLYLLQVKY